jgi:hypothetical protein
MAPRLATPERIAVYVDEIVTIFYDGLMLPSASSFFSPDFSAQGFSS